MNRSLSTLLVAFAAIGAACSSSPQTKTITPSLSAVVPDHVYQGTTVDVTIAGSATAWTTAPMVSFGSDITVNTVTVASPTALVVNITASASAETSARNVTVIQNGTTLTYTGAFTVMMNNGSVPSISALSPRSVFLGRTLDVLISGSSTVWDGTTTADFGQGVTVKSVSVASQTALLATIEVTPTAKTGLRDVNVATGSSTVTFKNAFEINSPIQVTTTGSLAQGSIVGVDIRNLDFANPFDTTTDATGAFANLVLTSSASGANFFVSNATTNDVQANLVVDVMAATGAADLTLTSGPAAGTMVSFPAPGALNIAARTATALTSAGVSSTTGDPGTSFLYSYTSPAGPTITHISASSSVATAQPDLIVLGESGSFHDFMFEGGDVLLGTTAATPYYAIFRDISGAAMTPFKLDVVQTSVTPIQPAANDNTTMAATMVSNLPAMVTSGALTSDSSVDYYAVTVSAADAGKTLRAVAYGGDLQTDAAVDIVSVDGSGNETSLLSLPPFGLPGPADNGLLPVDVATGTPVDTGTYYVKVLSGQAWSSSHTGYDLIIALQ